MAPLRALFALALALAAPAVTQAQAVPEHRVKAVFLLRFAQFVEWPRRAFASDTAPLVIGVYGPDPFEGYLDEIVQGERVDGRPIVVRHLDRLDPRDEPHIVFVSRARAARFFESAHELRSRPVLVVGDTEQFAHEGGMIAFVIEDNKVRFRINPEAARNAGLTLSSKLLRAADIVEAGRT